ncbi:hypothetical protein CA3LBN_002915 [Candidozyma haemuli]|uniref:non-specific serine/threonine protein kinase n=1 Tax=Candidozyma haemuli TaxID=45357 RepID=A0ABX8I674_9ASCO|nr:hypothetical protein CA3LBN_002915 [[Candida] haemuloni]
MAAVDSSVRPVSTSAALPSAAPGKKVYREMRLGTYVLGSTLGEGEFGKVKLGWRTNGQHPSQVAVKLIRRDSLRKGSESEIKVYREINSLRQLTHPNIVNLVEVVKSGKYIGIVLEYAPGGELFDYILQHKHLKEDFARKLFAQLVSGVDYMHSKGYVHRDLKLENLLLDKHKNIIISDFGFVNCFSSRRGDFMKTSCGSPCYAAPELVLSQAPYEGRKVDIWSMGIILYAMLAGYLPYDDDAENEDGTDITRLYNYIYKTPLTFPEYITPLARDLIRRTIVPAPHKRITMDEIRRHSWLAPYASLLSIRQPEWDKLSTEKKEITVDPIQRRSKRYTMYAENTNSSSLILGSAKSAQGRSYTSNSNIIYSPPTTSSSLATIVALPPNDAGSGSSGVSTTRNRSGSVGTTRDTSPTKVAFHKGHSKSASVSGTYPTASLALQAMVNEREAKRASLAIDADSSIISNNSEFPSPTRGSTYSGAIPTIAESPTNNEFPHKNDKHHDAKMMHRLPHSEKKPRPTSYHPGSMSSSIMSGQNISGNLLDYMKMGMPQFLSNSPPKPSPEPVESFQSSPGSNNSIKPRNSRRDSVVTAINVNGVLTKDLNSHENKRNSVLSYLEDKMEQLELSESPTKSNFSDSAHKFSSSSIPKLETELQPSHETPQINQSPTFDSQTDSPVAVGDETEKAAGTESTITSEDVNKKDQHGEVTNDENASVAKENSGFPRRGDTNDNTALKDTKKRNRFSLISFYSSFNESSAQVDNRPSTPTNNGRKILEPLNDGNVANHSSAAKEKRVGSGSSGRSNHSRKSTSGPANGTYVRGKEASAARKVMNFFKRKSIRAN